MLKQTSSLAIASVPVQEWDEVYTPEKSLCEGTIVPRKPTPPPGIFSRSAASDS